jgi:ABC-type multidrug transport system fused ATPase/permease subunit
MLRRLQATRNSGAILLHGEPNDLSSTQEEYEKQVMEKVKNSEAQEENDLGMWLSLNDVKNILLAVVAWFALSFIGLLLPVFVGLIFFFFLAPIIGGYIAGSCKKVQSILIVSLITAAFAGILGFGTIGSAPAHENVTGIDWFSVALILVWVVLDFLLALATGYHKFRKIQKTRDVQVQ